MQTGRQAERDRKREIERKINGEKKKKKAEEKKRGRYTMITK